MALTEIFFFFPLSIKGMCVQANGCLTWPDAELDQKLVRELEEGMLNSCCDALCEHRNVESGFCVCLSS